MRTIRYFFAVAAIAVVSSCDDTLDVGEPVSSDVVLSTLNGHEYVDLGLSVKWATCNVDALCPVEVGGYYAWGDDRPYSHIAHVLDSIGIHREDVIPSSASFSSLVMFKLDGVGRGLIKKGVDIASYKWGSGWRMPSYEEFKELYDNCIWQEVVIDDVVCFKGTSKIPGYTERSIVLPNTGLRFVDDETDCYEDGTYWTGTLHDVDRIRLFVFNAEEVTACFSGAAVGYPVRAVWK